MHNFLSFDGDLELAVLRNDGQRLHFDSDDVACNTPATAVRGTDHAADAVQPALRGAADELVTAATAELADGHFAACMLRVAAASRLLAKPGELLSQMELISRINIHAADSAWHEV